MKKMKFEDLLRETIAKYNSFALHLSKCNSVFSTQLFLDNFQLTSKTCDFGTWYFSQKKQIELPSLKDIEAPYIKIYELYKLLEIQFHSKLSKKDLIKKRLPFVKSEPNPVKQTIEDLEIQCLLFIHKLKQLELEYSIYKMQKKSDNQSILANNPNTELELSPAEIIETEIKLNNKTIQKVFETPKLNALLLNKIYDSNNYKSNLPTVLKETNSHMVDDYSALKQSEPFKPSEVLNESRSKNSDWESLMAMKKMMDSI